jgi:signal transduction histidine kinase
VGGAQHRGAHNCRLEPTVMQFGKQRLATRLVLSHLLVVALGLGVAGAGLLSQSRRYFVDAEQRSLLVQARVAAASCTDSCLSIRKSQSKINSKQLPPASNVKQSQINSPGNLVIDENLTNQVSAALPSNIRVFRLTDPAQSSLVVKAMGGRESSTSKGGTLTVATPIRRGGSILGAIQVEGSLSDVNAVLRDLRRQVLVAIGIGSLAALLFGLWRARALSRPLRELTIASRAIADGDFDRPLPTAKGHDEMAELTTTFADMRDRVKTELAVRNAFVADASHELRSPLTAIRGAVEILQTPGEDRPEIRARFLGSLDRETDRLLGLVNKLLELQTNEQSSIPNKEVRVDELARSVVADYQTVAAAKPLTLAVGELESVAVSGDADRLRQVVVNLIDNALTHSPIGGPVTIRVQMIDKRCRLEVEDHGPGIAESDRERAFDRFVRLDQSRDRQQGGAGLGLSIARAIAVAHGGTLTLHSSVVRTGTVARLELPVHQTDA